MLISCKYSRFYDASLNFCVNKTILTLCRVHLENNEYKCYDKSKCLEFYNKLVSNEKINMDIRIYSNGTYKMTKLF